MRTYKIYLIRHGMTKSNIEARYAGATDVPLCEEGILELKSLKEAYEYPGVGKVYTSPLKRAVQTAKLLYPAQEPFSIPGLSEYDFGVFEDKTIEELKENPDFKEWFTSGMAKSPKGAEDMEAFDKRVIEGYESVLSDMMQNRIFEAAVVTHGGVMMKLLSACGLPKRTPFSWAVKNGRGYTAVTDASLWSRQKVFEVYNRLPFGEEAAVSTPGFAFIDYLPEEERERKV